MKTEMRSAWAHGLKRNRLAGPAYPWVLPELDLLSLKVRMEGVIPPDPVLSEELALQQLQFKRVEDLVEGKDDAASYGISVFPGNRRLFHKFSIPTYIDGCRAWQNAGKICRKMYR